MTIPSWPSELPPPLRASYQAAPVENRLRRSGDGPPRFERLTSARTRTIGLQIVADRIQKSLFDQFFADIAQDGSLPFWMPDPASDGWPLATPTGDALVTSEGDPVLCATQLLCVFGDQMPIDTLRGIHFTISFNVTVLP